jgi:hypothetical protein
MPVWEFLVFVQGACLVPLVRYLSDVALDVCRVTDAPLWLMNALDWVYHDSAKAVLFMEAGWLTLLVMRVTWTCCRRRSSNRHRLRGRRAARSNKASAAQASSKRKSD